jgi:hypothetical protein
MRPRKFVCHVFVAATCTAIGSAAFPVVAVGATATLTLASSVAAGAGPTGATLTATVSGATLAGNIVFKDGPSTIGTVVINKSKAVLTTTLGVGIHRLVAAYGSGATAIGSPEVDVVVENTLTCKQP